LFSVGKFVTCASKRVSGKNWRREGMTVEVDEHRLFRRKYGVGRSGTWKITGCWDDTAERPSSAGLL
jgi:hypothetical protein